MNLFNTTLRLLFFSLVRVLVLVLLGLNTRGKHLLPTAGPAIVVANHNSHLDTMVLMSLLPFRQLIHTHPVAAADYFLSNPLLAWFSTKIIGIIPLERGKAQKGSNPFELIENALAQGKILILFPEGSRGEPEQVSGFKKGIARIAERFADVPITPVFTHGLGKALPKGDFVLVPFFCDIFAGEALTFSKNGNNRAVFMEQLNKSFEALATQKEFAAWE